MAAGHAQAQAVPDPCKGLRWEVRSSENGEALVVAPPPQSGDTGNQ